VKLLRVHLAHWDMSGEMEDISSLDSNTERCGHLWIAALIPQYTHTHTRIQLDRNWVTSASVPGKKAFCHAVFPEGCYQSGEDTHTHTHRWM